MAVKIDTLVTVPPHLAIAAGLGRKAILLINGEFRAETTRCSKCDLLHDGSVRLDFMTDVWLRPPHDPILRILPNINWRRERRLR